MVGIKKKEGLYGLQTGKKARLGGDINGGPKM